MKKPREIPKPPAAEPAPIESIGRYQVRVGNQRFAIDLKAAVTQLNPEPAEVIPIVSRREPRKLTD